MRPLSNIFQAAADQHWFTNERTPRCYESESFLTAQQDELIMYTESMLTLIYDFRRSQCTQDLVVSLGAFFRSITGRSVSGTIAIVFTKLAEELSCFLPRWQTHTTDDWVDILDDLHKNIHRVKGSKLGEKVISVFNHVVAHTFYYKMGIAVDPVLFHKIEKGHLYPTVWNVASFTDGLVGLLLFLAKAGRQAVLTKSVEPFFVDSTTISDWLRSAQKLRKDAEFLGNPTCVGIDTPVYLDEIANAIDDGNKMRRIFKGKEQQLIDSVVLELEMVQKRHQVSLAAASFRRCPFGLFLYGDSGVGKSFLLKGLFHHYCSVRGVDQARATLYPRNSGDKYYSGFKSSFMGIVFDDVAKHKAGKVIGVDESLADLISVANNIPFITNQAELCDKGKIPLLCEFMGVTSNLSDLQVHAYYENSYAVLRRMPYRIEPIVKPQFRKAGLMAIDPSKIPRDVQYPDCWEFEVCTVVRHNDLHGSYQPKGQGIKLANYSELLRFLTDAYQTHIEQQDRLMKTVNALGPEPLCSCQLPKSLCACVTEGEIISSLPEVIHIPDDDDYIETCFGPQVVAQASVTDVDMPKRIKETVEIRRIIIAKRDESVGLRHLFVENFLNKEFRTWMSDHINNQLSEYKNPQHILEHLEHCLKVYDESSRQAQVYLCMQQRADNLSTDDSYLTFTPTIGGRRNFLRSQMDTVYRMVLKYVQPMGWNRERELALEQFVYDKAPMYLALGWDDESIVRGACDYVDSHAHLMTENKEVQELLKHEANHHTLWERFARFCARQYVCSPTLRHGVDWVLQTRVGQSLGKSLASPAVHRETMVQAARSFDLSLKGDHVFVRVIIAVCSVGAVAMFLSVVVSRFTRASDLRPVQHVVGDRTSECSSHTTEPECEEEDGEYQLSVHTQGRLPIVRETDRVNVWHVAERNITSHDFVDGRMNKLEQLLRPLGVNTLYCEITAPHVSSGKTRILVVAKETFVMNNHACFDKSVLKVWYGKKTSEGVQPTFEVCIREEMVTRHPERDLAIVRTKALPAMFKDISRNLPRRSNVSVGSSFYLIKQTDGSVEKLETYGFRSGRFEGFQGDDGRINCDAFYVNPRRPTISGECGSPIVVNTPYGPLIKGIHSAWCASTNIAISVPIYYEDFVHVPMVQVSKVSFSEPVLQSSLQGKMYTDYHKDGSLVVFGRTEGFRSRPKANGRKTAIAQELLARASEFGFEVTDRLTQPDMSSWLPQQNILKEYLHPTHSIDEPVMQIVADGFVRHIESHLTEEDKKDIHVVPVSVAINGFPAVPNVDAQKFTTSAGYGFRGAKKGLVSVDEPKEHWPRYREYNDDVMDKVEKIFMNALKGVRSHPVFVAQLKDEMVSLKKRRISKTRGFYMCPVDYLTAIRMVTLGLSRVMVRRRDVFRNAVGLNTHSEEWNDLFEQASKIPGDLWVAGDFVGYDKILSILIQNMAAYVLSEVARMGEFTEEEILALETMIADTITAVVDFFSTLIMLFGGEVSGHQLTTFLNSICNIILHAYAWVIVHMKERCKAHLETIIDMFWDNVFIRVLGDDVFMKVHPDFPSYNHTSIQAVFKAIGIEYTMADKESESIPYISYKDVSFLKRSFREHSSFTGQMVAPLEMDSIWKMLLYTIPSKDVSPEEQLAMAICSAKSEAFYHDRDVYERLSALLDSLDYSVEMRKRMEQFPAPTWEQCEERYFAASPKYRAKMGRPASSPKIPTFSGSYCKKTDTEMQSSLSVDHSRKTTKRRSLEEPFQAGVRLSSKDSRKHSENEKDHSVENDFLSKNTIKQLNTTTWSPEDLALDQGVRAITHTLNRSVRRNKKMHWKHRTVCQADLGPDTQGNVTTTHEQITFHGEPEMQVTDLKSSASAPAASVLRAPQDLQNYLARPKLIQTYTWSESQAIGTFASFWPWRRWIESTEIQDKLRGWSLLRGNLHLKFVVNGSPFYYGAMLASYKPLTAIMNDNTDNGGPSTQLVGYSQRPSVWLTPQNMSTAEMTLPFFFPYPMVDYRSRDSLRLLGEVKLPIYAPLRSANGVTGSAIDIQIFAWMTDVELGGQTNRPVAQSSLEYKKDHQLSQVAGAVANAAGMLSSVPVVGPYAMATSTAAGAISKVASAFGFTNVPNTSDVEPMRQVPFSIASTEISAPLEKLTLTAKQETSIGGAQYGSKETDDPLVLSSLLARTSFLVGSGWPTSLVPGQALFTSAVMPCLFQRETVTVDSNTLVAEAHPPCSYFARMFQYWRGSLKFTFKAVRSKYHRGRLMIMWDRGATNLNEAPDITNMNTLSAVLDLDETDEVSFIVPYVDRSPFLRNTEFPYSGALPWSTDSSPPSIPLTGSNGVITVKVLNRLTAPEATSDVTLLMFVSMCEDDAEMAGPRDVRGVFSQGPEQFFQTLNARSATVAQSDLERPIESDTVQLQQNSAYNELYKDMFGEKVVSLRSLLHRSSLAFTKTPPSIDPFSQGVTNFSVPIKHFPPPVGFYNNGWSRAGTPAAPATLNTCNFVQSHPINLVAACFCGVKGSVNVQFNYQFFGDSVNSGYIDKMQITRVARTPSQPERMPSARLVRVAGAGDWRNDFDSSVNNSGGQAGRSLMNTRANPSLCVNLPYYSSSLFYIPDLTRAYNNNSGADDANNDWWLFELERYVQTNDVSRLSQVECYYSTGPDWDAFWFNSTPIVFYVPLVAPT